MPVGEPLVSFAKPVSKSLTKKERKTQIIFAKSVGKALTNFAMPVGEPLASSPTGTAEYGKDNAETGANDENDRQADEQGPHPRGIPKRINGHFRSGLQIFAIFLLGSPPLLISSCRQACSPCHRE